MRKVMTAAAVIALMTPFGAAAGDERKSDEKDKARTEAAHMEKDVVYLEADQLSARDLLGESIIGETGERIARVDDLVIDDEGKVSSVIFLEGGFFGLGEKGELDFERVDLAIEENRDPRIKVSMSEQAIKDVAEFDAENANDYSLASELIGATARLGDSDQEATITDLVLSKDGSVRHVVAQEGEFAMWNGDERVLAYNDLSFEQGAGGPVIDMSASEFARAPRFEEGRDANRDWDRRPGPGVDDGNQDWESEESDQQ